MFYVVGKWIEIYELGCLGGFGKIVNVLSCKCFDWQVVEAEIIYKVCVVEVNFK